MLVSRISPAPDSAARTAQSTASRPVAVRPPCVYTSHPPARVRFASIATTMHWLPNCAAPSRITSGRRTAAVFSPTLSAPARSMRRRSSTVASPPPTVNGIVRTSAVRRTTVSMMPRPSWLAVISRKTTSSAPSRSYAAASSTGSPASRRLTKRVPLTTRPFLTSRHAMTRRASISRPGGAASRRRRLPGRRQEVFQAHAPFVERAADDDALEPCRFEPSEAPHVVRRRHAAREDHRDPDGGEDALERRRVGPAHQAVPLRVGVDDPAHARLHDAGRCLSYGEVACFGPPLRNDAAVTRVERRRDAVAEAPARLAEQSRVAHRGRAEDHPCGPGSKQAFDRGKVPHPATHLDRYRRRGQDPPHRIGIARPSRERTVEIHDVEPGRPRGRPAPRHTGRIVVIPALAAAIALDQPDGAAPSDVNCRKHQHPPSTARSYRGCVRPLYRTSPDGTA